jgi:hypothetical protein
MEAAMKKFLGFIALGMLAGAFGTFILNAVTYLDMLIRGRQPSSVPSNIAGKLAESADVESIAEHNQSEEASARRSATGALMGYATGLSAGLAYGVLRSIGRPAPSPVAGIGVGLAAMAGSDVPATLTKVTNPAKWDRSAWLSDIVPHLAFGLATVSAFEAVASRTGASEAE